MGLKNPKKIKKAEMAERSNALVSNCPFFFLREKESVRCPKKKKPLNSMCQPDPKGFVGSTPAFRVYPED
jgi:hypothetical protein